MDELEFTSFNANRTEANDDSFETLVSIVVPILFSLIGIVGIIGNILVIITVVCNKQMRTNTNLLILNLSTFDTIFCVICIPSTVSTYFKDINELTILIKNRIFENT